MDESTKEGVVEATDAFYKQQQATVKDKDDSTIFEWFLSSDVFSPFAKWLVFSTCLCVCYVFVCVMCLYVCVLCVCVCVMCLCVLCVCMCVCYVLLCVLCVCDVSMCVLACVCVWSFAFMIERLADISLILLIRQYYYLFTSVFI